MTTETVEITFDNIIKALASLGGDGTTYEICNIIGIKGPAYKEMVRSTIFRMVERGMLKKIPYSELSRQALVGNKGVIKWAFKLVAIEG